jgi:hypothetical protein
VSLEADDWSAWVSFWGNAASIGSFFLSAIAFIVAIVALIYSYNQLVWARRSAAVATVVSIDASLRTAWNSYLTCGEDELRQRLHFGEVLNTWELACAVWEDRVFVGKAGDMMVDTICLQMKMVSEEPSMNARIEGLIEDPENFAAIVKFVREMKRRGRLRFINEIRA